MAVRPVPLAKKAHRVRQLVRRDLSATAARPDLLMEVHPDPGLVPRPVLLDPRPVLLWVTEVRRVLEMARRRVRPVPDLPVLEMGRRRVRPVPDRLVLEMVRRRVRPVPDLPVLVHFPLPACRLARPESPEHRRATADLAASSAA